MRIPTLLVLALAVSVAVLAGPIGAQEERREPLGVVVPVRGQIDTVTVRLIHRAVREAEQRGYSRVLLDIDTPGGPMDAMHAIENVLTALRDGGGPHTTAYVRRFALSAGGYIALACDDLYMGPGATIGAITPIVVGPGGPAQIPDGDVRAKLLSAVRADVRALVERRGNVAAGTLEVVEAMVDPRIGSVYEVAYRDPDDFVRREIVTERELSDLGVRHDAGEIRILEQQRIGDAPLTLTAEQAFAFGLSRGTYSDLEELAREELGVTGDDLVRLEPTWSESAVDWLSAMKPILFVLGFILLLVEVKAPGMIVPGVVGVVLIALGLFSSYLVGLAEWTEILLLVLGLGLIAIEVFVLPGTMVFGFLGFLVVIAALVLSNQTFVIPENATQQRILTENLMDLLLLVLVVIAGTVLFYRLMPSVPLFNRALLIPPEGPRTGDSTRFGPDGTERAEALLGASVEAVTDLRPAGIVELPDGRRLDVVSTGSFVARGARARIVAVDGNRIVVEAAEEAGAVSIGVLIFLVFLGLAMIVAEVFLISGGLLTIGAGVSLLAAIFLAFTHHGATTGFAFLLAAAVGAPAALAFALKALPHTAIGRKLLLFGPEREEVSGAAAAAWLPELLGRSGVTLSRLRPTGFARIDGRRVDVVTRGEMIEADVAVRVIQVDGNRVVVAAETSADGGASAQEDPASVIQ